MKGNCGECNLRWACDIDQDKCNAWPDPVHMTNADCIRNMSDEELADFLNQWGTSTRAWQKDPGETLYWLQMPAGE